MTVNEYSVYVVVIKDTLEAFEKVADVVANYDEAARKLTITEAEEMMEALAGAGRRGDFE
jgi:hypothetical protein